MGVAVIFNTWGNLPVLNELYCSNARRCSTQNLCCSSTIVNTRFSNWTVSSISACVPITTDKSPFFRRDFTSIFCFGVSPPTKKSEVIQNPESRFIELAKCWRARISVGARIATWTQIPSFLLSRIAWIAAINTTIVFPVQTSPWSRRCIEKVRSISLRIWKRTTFCPFVRGKESLEIISFTVSGFIGIFAARPALVSSQSFFRIIPSYWRENSSS